MSADLKPEGKLCVGLPQESMGDFCSAADLKRYLIEISPRYSKYAADLWDNNIRSPTELANVPATTLAECGVSNVAHAENIQVHVKNAGEDN